MKRAEAGPLAMTLGGLRRAYADGLHPSELVRMIDAAIASSGRDEAWIFRLSLEKLLERAAELEYARDSRSSAAPLPPLWGIPFAVKDNIDVAGLPTTAGCPAYAYTPKSSAPVVARLIEAGAILLGKTNMDQFATGLVGVRSPYGACRNIFNPDYIAGGSSSGSGIAVAAGWAAFALGTDTAGSGRVPAAFGGIVGLKPSLGLLSTEGVVPACSSIDCVSIFAENCEDALEVLQIAEGSDAAGRLHSLGKSFDAEFRFGAPLKDALDFDGDAEAERLYHAAAARLESIGGERIEIDWLPFRDAARMLYGGPFVAERYAAVGAFIEAHPDEIDPTVREIILGGKRFASADVRQGREALEKLILQAEPVWRSIDCLLLPTTPTIYTIEQVRADPVGKNSRLGIYTNFVNLMNLAAVALPAGKRADGLALGVTLIALAGSDEALCRLGTRFLGASSTGPKESARTG